MVLTVYRLLVIVIINYRALILKSSVYVSLEAMALTWKTMA